MCHVPVCYKGDGVVVDYVMPPLHHQGQPIERLSKSICRSFGILVWEVMTLGQQPYPARSNAEVLEYVRTGGTLNRPEKCSQRL